MNQDTKNLVVPMLTSDEGRRRFPYLDTGSPPQTTIGIGRNLSAKGLSMDEQNYLFQNDLKDAEGDAVAVIGETCFNSLTPKRQAAMINMAFNLGRDRMAAFKDMVTAIQTANYAGAAAAMRASRWYGQIKNRAERLAIMMESG